MGNQLAATAPSQIVSVESYLADTEDYTYDKSLGSTRFMKVARAKFHEGLTVMKVFVIPDSTFSLEAYKNKVETTRIKLKQSSNCLPFQKTLITVRAALLVRQYVKHNLYDRISTRPFYNNIERRWVAFQLLCALNQISQCNVWHGDIKSENIMITSWNWLLLTDFASYKPTYLPDDNPADFNYFFDTSRRRACYVAPERFTDNLTVEKRMSEQGSSAMHAMDIFSAGCVIAELFTDGTAMFDLAQLLAYREKKYHPNACLEKITDPQIRSLVEHMIQIDPSHRYTAEHYLTEWKGKAFPDHFYTFLKCYLGQFCEHPLLSADQVVSQLYQDTDKILQNLVYKETSESLVIVASLLLSCTRQLKYCNGKLKTLHIITQYARHLKSTIILERFVPYLMIFIKDNVTRVRAGAISALATCLSFVTQVPRGESNIYSEYILPEIGLCANDKAVPVRQAFAENIAVFAERALKFLDSPQSTQPTSYIGADQTTYDSQLQLLRQLIQNKVQVVLSDPDSTVRQCLLEHSVARLCAFFGRQKANDVILSHMITFLNDKEDWLLRASFFRNLVPVAAYIGWQSSHILKPLLQQGLSDNQEFVVAQTMAAISSLVELGLLPKQLICELIQENVLFLVHPCEWIRQNTIAFICASSKLLDSINTHCYILPTIMPFLKYPIVQADKENVMLGALRPFVKHSIYEMVSCSSSAKMIFSALRARQLQRNSQLIKDDEEGNPKIESALRKLFLKNMDENDEDMLLYFEGFVMKQQKNRLGGLNEMSGKEWQNDIPSQGIINIADLGTAFVRRHADLVKEVDIVNTNKIKPKKLGRKKNVSSETIHDMNEDWKTLFGNDSGNTKLHSNPSSLQNRKVIASNISISMSQLENAASQSNPVPENKPSNFRYKYASCKIDLRALVHHKRDLYQLDRNQRELEDTVDDESIFPLTEWQATSLLVAHMKEHRGPINRVVVSPSNHHFVTVSSDRSIRLWEGEKLEGKAVVNRSKASWQRFGGPLRCAAFQDDRTIMCSSDDGYVHSLSVELMGSRPQTEKSEDSATPKSPIQFSHEVNQSLYGHITDLKSIVNSPIAVFTTSYGSIIALDTRSRRLAWELKHDLSLGLPTSFCIDPKQHWLCLGTVRGTHECWDLRFQLPITKFSHPSLAGVRRIIPHPTVSSCIVSVVTGNNEVSVWDIETGTRQMTLWASSAPALSLTQKTNESINGICATISGNGGIRMYTGGTDSKIRLWDLINAERSRLLCGPEFGGSRSHYSVSYHTRLVDGTHVVEEQMTKLRRETSDTSTPSQTEMNDDKNIEKKRTKPGEHAVPVHHHDVITDLATFQVNQTFLVSTSRDGVVKVWK